MSLATRSNPSTSAPGDGSRTITITNSQPRPEGEDASGDENNVIGALRLRAATRRNSRRVVWDENVVDNEGCGRKSSKSTHCVQSHSFECGVNIYLQYAASTTNPRNLMSHLTRILTQKTQTALMTIAELVLLVIAVIVIITTLITMTLTEDRLCRPVALRCMDPLETPSFMSFPMMMSLMPMKLGQARIKEREKHNAHVSALISYFIKFELIPHVQDLDHIPI
jgi:hypothetical protein